MKHQSYALVTNEISTKRVSNVENVSMPWRHHALLEPVPSTIVCKLFMSFTAKAVMYFPFRDPMHIWLLHQTIHFVTILCNNLWCSDSFARDIVIMQWIIIYRIKISLKFVPKVAVNNIPALVQMLAWCYPGDKPLSEPMMVSLPTHICVAWLQWVKKNKQQQNKRKGESAFFIHASRATL